jgi:hypothetical protein
LLCADLKLPRDCRSHVKYCHHYIKNTCSTQVFAPKSQVRRLSVSVMAPHYSPSNSTQSISDGTSPSSLFLHDLDSEVFEVSLLLGQHIHALSPYCPLSRRRQTDLAALLGGKSWISERLTCLAFRRSSWAKKMSAPPWAVPLATSRESLSTSVLPTPS